MKREFNIVRRQWIITLASSPIFGFLTSAKSMFGPHYHFANFITKMLNDRANAKHIGELYLQDNPQEANMKKILTILFQQDPMLETLTKENNIEAHNRIKILQKDDFKKENIVSIDGWILSLSEARLCALTTFIT